MASRRSGRAHRRVVSAFVSRGDRGACVRALRRPHLLPLSCPPLLDATYYFTNLVPLTAGYPTSHVRSEWALKAGLISTVNAIARGQTPVSTCRKIVVVTASVRHVIRHVATLAVLDALLQHLTSARFRSTSAVQVLLAITRKQEEAARWLIDHGADLRITEAQPEQEPHPGRPRKVSVTHASAQNMSLSFNRELWPKMPEQLAVADSDGHGPYDYGTSWAGASARVCGGGEGCNF